MASMNISIKKEAYDFLKKMKGENQSFSDVILGFRKEQKDVMQFFGALKDVDWQERVREMKKLRRDFDDRP